MYFWTVEEMHDGIRTVEGNILFEKRSEAKEYIGDAIDPADLPICLPKVVKVRVAVVRSQISRPKKEGGTKLKKSAQVVLDYLRSCGDWRTTVDIIRNVGTVTPSKRLSELRKAKLIEDRKRKGNEKEYRAKTMPEILLGRTA